MAVQPIIIYRGDTISGVINLRVDDLCSGIQSDYAISLGSTIYVSFPATDPLAPAVLSSLLGEVSIIDASKSIISLNGTSATSLLMKIGKAQSINCVVIQGVGGKEDTFQVDKILTVADRANPIA